MADPAQSPNIVADRYLASPAGLRSAPSGPVDALDTHSGRACQVRLVFVTGAWTEHDLADAVARWCAIGCGEICGVLDFGRHGDHWFMALPPSLGVPVERWRTMRLPGAADAARLTLGFGRLVDRVAAAGFAPELAAVEDFAIGPGPTPFLERPLLPLPGAAPDVTPGGGQRLLARLLRALLGGVEPPAGLAAWLSAAASGGFATLAACLDDLERAGSEAVAAAAGDPPGLHGLFDEDDLDRMEAAARRAPGRVRRIAAAAGLGVLGLAAGIALVGAGSGDGRAAQAAPRPRTVPVAPAPAWTASAHHRPGRAADHRHRPQVPARHRRRRHPAQGTPTPSPAPTPTTPAPAPSATSDPAPTSPAVGPAPGTGGTVLPAPGGTTLPAP